MGFVCVVDGSSDGMKLVTQGLESTGVDSDGTSAALHQLEIIFEADLTGFGAVAEGVFEGGPDLTGCGEADCFSHGFFSERREKKAKEALISGFPRQVFGVWCLRGRGIKWRWRHNGTVHMPQQILALKKWKKLALP